MVGFRRYVHLAFAVLGLFGAMVLSNLFALIGESFSFSYPILGIDILAVAGWVIAGVGAFLLWRDERVFGFAEEVVNELKKVTWPTYEETRSSTMVVLAIVAVFAVGLGIFDFIWSGLTNYLVHTLAG